MYGDDVCVWMVGIVMIYSFILIAFIFHWRNWCMLRECGVFFFGRALFALSPLVCLNEFN